ncbi:MAG TPA: hypothetical protein VEB86_09295, partial [Chryseosolibacter sp.]|nr:hypothetical protein [Chryseosolibacter sp.]
MRFAVVTSLFFSFGTLLAQDMGEQMAADDTIRDYYIEHFPDYFFLYPVLKQRSLNFELEKEGNNGALVTFKPNNTYSFGLGMYLFELNFELAF